MFKIIEAPDGYNAKHALEDLSLLSPEQKKRIAKVLKEGTGKHNLSDEEVLAEHERKLRWTIN